MIESKHVEGTADGAETSEFPKLMKSSYSGNIVLATGPGDNPEGQFAGVLVHRNPDTGFTELGRYVRNWFYSCFIELPTCDSVTFNNKG